MSALQLTKQNCILNRSHSHIRCYGMLATAMNFLGLGNRDRGGTQGQLEGHRADILEARALQASSTLRKLLRKRNKQPAWEYFSNLCDGPDINVQHCASMFTACTSADEIDKVVALMRESGLEPNSVFYT